MGTIINDFFYQDDYQNEFDRLINEQMWSSVTSKNVISDYYEEEHLFNEIVKELSEFIEIHKQYTRLEELLQSSEEVDVEKLKEEIDTLDGIIIRVSELNRLNEGKEYQGLLSILKRDRANRSRIIGSNSDSLSDLRISYDRLGKILAVKSSHLTSLYNELNKIYDRIGNNEEEVQKDFSISTPLTFELTKKIISPDTVNYIINEVDVLLEEEMDYLQLIDDVIPLLSKENIDYNDLSNLEDLVKKGNNIKEVLAIKKELLAKMYFKLTSGIRTDFEDNQKYVSQEIYQLDSATDYVEHMLNMGEDCEITTRDFIQDSKDNIDDTYVKDINRRLTNVYLSHISPIRVVK